MIAQIEAAAKDKKKPLLTENELQDKVK